MCGGSQLDLDAADRPVASLEHDVHLTPSRGPEVCENDEATGPRTPSKAPEKPGMKSGLPGTPEEQRRQIRAAIEENAETLGAWRNSKLPKPSRAAATLRL